MTNLSQVTFVNDNVFGEDQGARQLGTIEGDVASGYKVALTVPIDPTAVSTGAAGGGPGGPGGPGAPPAGGGPGGPPPSGGRGGPPGGPTTTGA